MPRQCLGFATLALGLLLAASGCSKSTVKVEGKVTLDGKPLDRAAVAFVPEDGNGVPANGLTGSDGVFRLTTFTTGDGVRPGNYKVTITKVAVDDSVAGGTVTPSDSNAMKDAYKKFLDKPQHKDTKPKSSVPAVYGDAGKTPLKAKVPTDGPIEFDLKSTGGS
jgi:hypothetical protein